MLDVPLVIIDSPYRSFVAPVVSYIDALDRADPGQYVTVVLPEFRTRVAVAALAAQPVGAAAEERADRPAEHRDHRGAVPPGRDEVRYEAIGLART